MQQHPGVSLGNQFHAFQELDGVSGAGTLQLDIDLTGDYGQLADPRMKILLTDTDGNPARLEQNVFIVEYDALENLEFSLPGGWYKAAVELYDGDTAISGNLHDRHVFFPRIITGELTEHTAVFDIGNYDIGDIGPAGGLIFYEFSAETAVDGVGGNSGAANGALRSSIQGNSGLKFFDNASYVQLNELIDAVPNVVEAKIYVRSDHPDDRVGIVMGNYEGGGSNEHTMGWEVYYNGRPRIWWDGGNVDCVFDYDVRKDRWIHLRWVRDTDAGRFRLFVDDGDADGRGDDVTEITVFEYRNGFGAGNTVNLNQVPRTLRIGSDYPNTRQSFNGYISDVKICNASEQLVAYYPMDRYLEAAPHDVHVLGDGTITCDAAAAGYDQDAAASKFVFGFHRETASGDNIAAGTYSFLGAGEINTQNLVSLMGGDAYTGSSGDGVTPYYPARLCDELVHNGYDDWFMPSHDEIYELCRNLHASFNPLSTFSLANYWSSTEISAESAYLQDFSNIDTWSQSTIGADRGNIEFTVRPIRSF